MERQEPSIEKELQRHLSGNAVDILLQQHEQVRSLFTECRQAEGQERKQIVNQLSDALVIHTQLEERFFYPALRGSASDLVTEALSEHNEVDEVLFQLNDLSYLSPDFDGLVSELQADVDDHLEMEENELFPIAREQLNLESIASDMRAAIGSIHPSTIRNDWQKSGGPH